ncbi:MAG TPA: VWA domain-containing protein, partial [Verrucomicrobiae bacterium]|nr:VWA domain-containing protein [Verrucomicrobiae bacterium]
LRLLIVLLLVLAIAGLQWKRPQEGMNVFFLLDRSDSVPSQQQESAREYVTKVSAGKKKEDNVGVLVFGTEAAIESSPLSVVRSDTKIYAVVDGQRSDIASAIRLGSAAFPETGQKRLVLLSDGNENIGDAFAAAVSARSLGVSIDVVPLGVSRGGDISVQKLSLPGNIKKGQTFEVKIFAQADQAQHGTIRLFQNDQLLGEQKVRLEQGKNLFSFPQTLTEPGFYGYDVRLEAGGDVVPQNNRAINFTTVRGDPRILIVSSEPDKDAPLAAAMRSANLEVVLADITKFPGTLAEMQSYDSIFLCNIAAGDLGNDLMKLLESAVRDFGIGLVCVGGDQAFAAGSYRGTPLESTLPVDMELSSKKVLPPGAVVLIMHGMEFMNGNQIARDCAVGVLEALGPQDEMGVLLWDGTEKWLFDLAKVGDKKAMRRQIAGMNQGDLPSFQGLMTQAHGALKKSQASLKHVIVFSDGDPGPPSQQTMQSMVSDRMTVSTVLIAGHAGPETMISIAEQGRGRFYDVRSPDQLPQIFIKEAAVILKSAIYEEPFKPQVVASSELIRGISGAEYPQLRGYVATSQKARAETPLMTDKGDPLLAHWQYGLGRAAAFTSDARAKWAQDWLAWIRYRQFWSQIANWSLRRLDNADFTTDVTVDKGEGVISVEALDSQGNFRNFLNLQAVIVSPKGEKQTVRLEQTGPGHYETRFPTKEVGAYLLHLMDIENGQLRGSQVLGASVNYSPEFNATEPNFNLVRRLAEASGGKILDPELALENPFLHDRVKTFQPRDLWEWLLKLAILLFPLDVGIRRIYLDKAEWLKATRGLRRWLFFWRGVPRTAEADESLAALLARRDQVRAKQTVPVVQPSPELFKPERPVVPPARPKEPVLVSGDDPPVAEGQPTPAEGPASTASRLLEAKRRAQRRTDR